MPKNKKCSVKVDELLIEELPKKREIMKKTLKDLKAIIKEMGQEKKLAS